MARSRRKTRTVEEVAPVEEVKIKEKKIKKIVEIPHVPEPPAPQEVKAVPSASEERVTRSTGKRAPGLLRFRLLKGTHLEGRTVYREGDCVDSFRDLDTIWPGRFERCKETKLSYNPAKAPPVK